MPTNTPGDVCVFLLTLITRVQNLCNSRVTDRLGRRASWRLLGDRGGAMQEFSVVAAVLSSNSLHHILVPNVALGVWQGAKCGSTPSRLVQGRGEAGDICYRELRRIPLPRTRVNRGS